MFLFLLACRMATPVSACDLDEANCIACQRDAECGYTGNACTETVYCAHQDASIAVIEIGCSKAVEYQWPDASTCGCVDGFCAVRE